MQIPVREEAPEPGETPPASDVSYMALLERIAVGVEKLGDDIVIEAESKPPVCPSCERMNPNVTVSDKEASGDLASFVIQARCNHCQNVLYAMPILWETFRTVDELRNAMMERDELSGISQRQN
jgi:hypothetical protein